MRFGAAGQTISRLTSSKRSSHSLNPPSIQFYSSMRLPPAVPLALRAKMIPLAMREVPMAVLV